MSSKDTGSNNSAQMETEDGLHLPKAVKNLVCGSNPTTGDRNTKEHETDGASMYSVKEFDWDGDNVYDSSHPNRGLAVIINNINFKFKRNGKEIVDERVGAKVDSDRLKISFEKLGFKVKLKYDLSAKGIVKYLKKVSRKSIHKKSDLFACAICSHGDESFERKSGPFGEDTRFDSVYGVDGILVSVKMIVDIFNDANCPALQDKPRIFFLEACRGGKSDPNQPIYVMAEPTISLQKGAGDTSQAKHGSIENQQKSFSSRDEQPMDLSGEAGETTEVLSDEDSTDDEDEQQDEASSSENEQAIEILNKNPPITLTPLYKDCLIMYATSSGYGAYLNEVKGSRFIQSLCDVFDSSILESNSLLSALTLVCNKVGRYPDIPIPVIRPDIKLTKEASVIEVQLTKDVFLQRKAEGAGC